jgi:hypothetical protein
MPLLQIPRSSGRRRCSPVAGEPIHPDAGIHQSILNGVVVIAVVLWLLNIFGLFHSLARVHVGLSLIP